MCSYRQLQHLQTDRQTTDNKHISRVGSGRPITKDEVTWKVNFLVQCGLKCLNWTALAVPKKAFICCLVCPSVHRPQML